MLPHDSAGRIVIDRLRINYHHHAATGAAQSPARLERIVRDSLDDACVTVLAEVMSQLEPANSQAVYRVRQLQASLFVSIDAAPDAAEDVAIATRWARSIGAELSRVITGGASSTVIRFDSPAEYLAAFLADLLAGFAGSRWYFAEFAHLCDLPLGRAMALLLAGQPNTAVQVLTRLRALGQLEPLLGRLTEPDGAALWSGVLGLDAATLPDLRALDPAMLGAARSALVAAGAGNTRAPVDRMRSALRLYVAAVAQHPDLAGNQALGDAIRAVLLLAGTLPTMPRNWLASLLHGDARVQKQLADFSAQDSQGMRWLMDGLSDEHGRQQVRAVAEVAALAVPHLAPAAQAGDRPVISSEWAGLFLLVPALQRLRLAHRLAELPAFSDDADLTNVLIYLLAVACAGPDARAGRVQDDPALAILGGLTAPPPPTMFADLASTDAQAYAAWGTRLAIGTLSAPLDLVSNAVRRSDWWTVVLRDVTSQRWVQARAFADPVADIDALTRAGVSVRSVFPNPKVELRANSAVSGSLTPPGSADDTTIAANAQQRLVAEMEHAWLGDTLPVDAATSMAVGLAAILTVRELASHLPGFEASTLPYLAQNFLHATGTVELAAERIDVRISASPLQIILRMAGLDGETAPIAWLGGRRLAIQLA